MTDEPTNVLAGKIALQRAENDGEVIQNQRIAIIGLLILGGVLMVCMCIVGMVYYGSDSDMTDALQTCGVVKVQESGEIDKNLPNPSVDECRKQVLDFFKEKTK